MSVLQDCIGHIVCNGVGLNAALNIRTMNVDWLVVLASL